MATIRLTAAQALVRYLAAQRGELDGTEVPLFAGVWAISIPRPWHGQSPTRFGPWPSPCRSRLWFSA